MSENPEWEITLASSSNMQSIGLLPYTYTLSPTFNRAGSFNMTLPLDDEIAYKIVKHSTCVICQRNDSVKWSGEIVTIGKDPQAMTLSFSALGWLDELNHRWVRPEEEASLIFADATSGTIVQTLLAVVNAQTTTDLVPAPTHLSFESSSDTQLRTRSYKRGQNYGQAIQELIDVENGIDISVSPLTRTISTFAPTSFTDRPNVVFGYGVEPFNLSNAAQTDDGTATANRVTAVGSNGVVVPADDGVLINAHGGMREEWISLSDVADPLIIGAYANAELVYRGNGKVTYDLKPLPYGDVPRLYEDFDLGDKIYLSIDAGALKVDKQAIRVFSATIEGDSNGNSVMASIGTAPE